MAVWPGTMSGTEVSRMHTQLPSDCFTREFKARLLIGSIPKDSSLDPKAETHRLRRRKQTHAAAPPYTSMSGANRSPHARSSPMTVQGDMSVGRTA